MQVAQTAIPDVKLLTPRKFGDHRGFFSETYNQKRMAEAGIRLNFVQDNHSFSAEPGTVRGLHYQIPPFAQDKLVRVVRGAILDVALDIRRSSPTFGKWVSAVISAEAWNQILVPIGFAHGLITLEPNTDVIYKVTNFWSPDHERGILWNDPALGIDWRVASSKAIVLDRDQQWPTLADQPDLFE